MITRLHGLGPKGRLGPKGQLGPKGSFTAEGEPHTPSAYTPMTNDTHDTFFEDETACSEPTIPLPSPSMWNYAKKISGNNDAWLVAQCRRKFLILPDSNFTRAWDTIVGVASLYNIICSPYEMAFAPHQVCMYARARTCVC